jgi:hypothetical protein
MDQHRGHAGGGDCDRVLPRDGETQTLRGMKGKQLALILILLAIIGGAALFFYHRSSQSWSETATTAGKRILNFAPNEVAHITIKSSAAEVNLAKTDGVWKVKERADYPANFELISNLITKIWELSAVQDVQAGPSQFGRLELLPPDEKANSATLLDLKDGADKRLAALLIGKKFMRESNSAMGAPPGGIPIGRYVKAEGKSAHVVLVNDLLSEVDPQITRWLNHDFIKVENPKSITLAGTKPEQNWKVVRSSATDSWKLADAKPGEDADNSRITNVVNYLTTFSFADVLAPNAQPAETGLDHPSTLTIETFDNFTYVLRVGKMMGENYPMQVSVSAQLPKERVPGKDEKPEEKTKLDQEFQAKQKQLSDKLEKEKKLESRAYLVSKNTIDQLTIERKGLLAEKATPSPTPTPPPSATAPTPAKPARKAKSKP